MMPVMARWPLLVKESEPEFLDEPPEGLGEIVGAWTNNTARGLLPTPLWLRLMWIAIGLCLGFVVGLIGIFVVGGIYEHRGGHVDASWFLDSIIGGAVLGMLAMLPLALRKPTRQALFVGTDGCAQLSRGRVDILRYRDVEDLRDKISTVTHHGIRQSARELHVRKDGRRLRLWFVSKVSDEGGTDPGYQFGDAVVRAFAAFRAREAAPAQPARE